jgi:hypothetical protein
VSTPEHLVWLVGHHLDQRAKVRPETARPVALIAAPPEVDAG